MPTFLQPDIHCEYLVEVILSQLSFKVVIGFLGRLIDIQKVVRLTCCRLVFLFNGFNVSKRSAQNKAKAKQRVRDGTARYQEIGRSYHPASQDCAFSDWKFDPQIAVAPMSQKC